MGSLLANVFAFLASDVGQKLMADAVTEVEHLAGFVESVVNNVGKGVSAAAGVSVTTPAGSAGASASASG